MRKTLASTGAAVLLLGLGIGVTTNAMAETQRVAKPNTATALARADQALGQHVAAIRGVAGEKYTARRTIIDQNGASHVRYERTYHGLRVRGGDFIVHNAPGGAFAGTNVAQPAAITVGTTPTKTAAQATAAAKKVFKGKLTKANAPELIVDATKAPRLAWQVKLEGWQRDGQTPSRFNVFVDATTGAVVDSYQEIEEVLGTGHSIFVGNVSIDTTPSGSGYTMIDPSHGNGNTCDMKNGTSTCTNFTDTDNVWGNNTNSDRASAGVDAHFGAAMTFDFYKQNTAPNSYNRNGIFNDGRGVPSRVHYGSSYINAFWDGAQMTYGDGAGNAKPLLAIDVAGHEMSHGVSAALANLGYSGDVGGINEANSDIFGTMVEFYAANHGSTDVPDYDIGEMIDINGDGSPLRYMYNPNLDGASDNCWTSATPGKDPHYSSGVGNHLFYLLAEGSAAGPLPKHASPTCGAPAVAGIGREKAAYVWYHALDAYMTSTETYKQARADTLKSATDIYGNCSAEYQQVQAAWSAVSVTGTDSPCGTPTSPPPTSPPPTSPPPTSPPPAGGYYENGTDVAIPDYPGAAVTSSINVTGQTGNASSTLKVHVDIKHTWRGDLVVDLIAPDGSVYNLANRTGGSADNIIQDFTVNASSEVANGTWKLRAKDNAAFDTGKIDLWSLQF